QTRPGMLTAITDAIVLHPDRATFLARIIMGEATSARVARLLRQALKSSPPDLTAFEDEAAVHDYQRAVRHFAAGRVEGFIAEQKALAKPTVNARGVRSDNWRMLFGAHDPLHASDHAEKHWRRLMPDARFRRLNDGGRFLFLSHPTEIVSALARCPPPRRRAHPPARRLASRHDARSGGAFFPDPWLCARCRRVRRARPRRWKRRRFRRRRQRLRPQPLSK